MTKEECFQVAEAIRKKWGPVADARGPLFVPLESRTILLVSSIGAVLDNGGFEYLLEGQWSEDEELEHSIGAFRRIGCVEAANVITFVMSHVKLQAGSSTFDPEECIGNFKTAFPLDAREELNGRFWDQHDEIEEKLAAYVFANYAQIDDQLLLDVKKLKSFS